MPVGRTGDVFVIDTVEVGTLDRESQVEIPGDFRHAQRLVVEVAAQSAEPTGGRSGSLDLWPLDSFDGRRWHRPPIVGGERSARMLSERPETMFRVGVPFAPRLAVLLRPDEDSTWHGILITVGSYAGTWTTPE